MVNYSAKELQKAVLKLRRKSNYELKSLGSILGAIVRADDDAIINSYKERAGIAGVTSRTQLEKTDFFARVEGLIPHYLDGDKKMFVELTKKEQNALKFSAPKEFKNIVGEVCEKSFNISATADEVQKVFAYSVEVLESVPVTKQIKYTSSDGKTKIVNEKQTNADGTVKTKSERVTYYIAQSSRKYSFVYVFDLFCEVAGIVADIKDAKKREADAKTAESIANLKKCIQTDEETILQLSEKIAYFEHELKDAKQVNDEKNTKQTLRRVKSLTRKIEDATDEKERIQKHLEKMYADINTLQNA